MAKQNIKDPGAHHNSSGALIRRFLPYLAKYKAVLFLDLFCAALTTLCDIFLPKIMSTITNSAMGVGITLTTGIVLKLAGIYFVLRIIDGAAQYFMSGIGHIMGVHIETDMRRDAFDHLLLLDHTYYNNTKVGTIMGRITNDLFDVTEFAHHCPEEFFIAFIKILASFIILCQASIPLTLAVFACVPLMGVVSVYLNGRLRARFRQQRIQIGELNATIEDSLLGQGVVKAFAAEEQERAKFEQGNKDFEHIKTLGYYAMAAFNTSTRLFDGLMYLVVILAGGLSLVNGKITAGDLVAYMLYVTTLIATIRRIVEFAEQFQRGMTGIERFAEIMDTPVPIHDAPDAKPLQPGPGAIRFDDVSFEYPDDHNKVLHHVSLDIKAGERLALVGPSGGGKTTLCNLIPRFYDVTSGHIYIDGQDIQQVTLKSLREDIGIVQQDVYLFSGSVADNIAYGKPDATREEIIEAARLAGAERFIMALKDGFNTYVGERGVKLSGGQKQRIAIARVFLKNPPILILDEATSALDNESEILVGQSLEKLAHGRTTLTIAHRLTTIKNYDRILVLGSEGIVESGTHDQLLAAEGCLLPPVEPAARRGHAVTQKCRDDKSGTAVLFNGSAFCCGKIKGCPLFVCIILFLILRVVQMLALSACQCGAQLQQCKTQDTGKNTGNDSTDPVSIGKTADQRNRHHSNQRTHGIGRGRIQKVTIPQTIAQTRNTHIDAADHKYNPLSGSLVRSPEHRLHDPRRQKAAPHQPEATPLNFAQSLLLHLVRTGFSCCIVKIS